MNNQLVVETRDTGKTTYLFNEVKRIVADGYRVIIMDSATAHEDKSLLKKVMYQYPKAKIFDVRDEKTVTLQHGYQLFLESFECMFPVKQLIDLDDKIICFDLSYFLEKGHDIFDQTNNRELYNYYRTLYNSLAQQIITGLIMLNSSGKLQNTIVVMDEIEFPIVDFDITLFQKDISFIAAAHPENTFGTFYQSFKRVPFKVFRRK